MFRLFFFTAVLGTALHAQTNKVYPMTIRCADPSNTDGRKVEIGLNLVENEAYFNYIESDLSSKVVIIQVSPAYGIYSSSSVSMESSSGDSFQNSQKIVISGHASRVTRVLDYSRFSLTMTKNNDGAWGVKELNYERGNDAFPEGNISATLNNLALTCTMSNQ